MDPHGELRSFRRDSLEDRAGHKLGDMIWDMLGRRVDLPDGGTLPEVIHIDLPGADLEPSVKATFVVRSDGTMGCTALSLTAERQGAEVRSKDIAAARANLHDWMRATYIQAMIRGDEITDEKTELDARRRSYNAADRKSRRKVTNELLAEVATIYRDNIDDLPRSAIAVRFNVSESTAARYIVLARRAGLLPQTELRQKKA